MATVPNTVPFIVAIDGPAGSGKTTTAKALAEALNFIYVDTGAMYRAVALHMMLLGIDVADVDNVCAQLPEIQIRLEIRGGSQCTMLNGVDVEAEIRTQEMSKAASDVSAVPCVREAMVQLQRNAVGGADGPAAEGAILEGRDIGTVVFPDSPCKVFLVADVDTRARRRVLQLREKGLDADIERVRQEIAERDRNDAARAHSPLRKAPDAIEVETTNTSIDEQVSMILTLVRKRMDMLRKGEL